MKYNSDLALEHREQLADGELDGIRVSREEKDNAAITTILVENEDGARRLGKPAGTYITVEITPFTTDGELFDGRLDAVAESLKRLLPDSGLVLIAGLGNDEITPDALGPKAVSYVLATRHISSELGERLGLQGLRSVATIVPGVLGQTGMETGEIIQGLVRAVKPDAVVVIDALASMNLSRLGCTVQMTDTGIVPGSGVGNHRFEISSKSLGVPVVSMGIPTVVDAGTLVGDLCDKNGLDSERLDLSDFTSPHGQRMVVTPKEIDTVIERGAKLIGMGLNLCLQETLSAEDIFTLVG